MQARLENVAPLQEGCRICTGGKQENVLFYSHRNSAACSSECMVCHTASEMRKPSQTFCSGFLLLHHFHSIEAAVRECRLLLCYTRVKKHAGGVLYYGTMDQRWTPRSSAGHPLVFTGGTVQHGGAGRPDPGEHDHRPGLLYAAHGALAAHE